MKTRTKTKTKMKKLKQKGNFDFFLLFFVFLLVFFLSFFFLFPNFTISPLGYHRRINEEERQNLLVFLKTSLISDWAMMHILWE